MVTLTDLKKAKMMALKEKDTNKQAVLGVIIAAYQKNDVDKRAKGQEMTDADMVQVLNKTVKELTDERDMYASANRAQDVANAEAQIAYVKSFLPAMMSEEEIKAVIAGLADKSVKNIMVVFKTQYAGKADMATVSKLAKAAQ